MKYNGRCFYHTLQNVSNIKKSQCLTETSISSILKKDLAIFRGKTMPNVSNIKKSQCLTETSNSSLSKKDLAILRRKTMHVL